MTVGARLRSKAASGFLRRGPRGRARADGDEEAAALLEQPERGDEAASAGRPGARSARKVHLAVLPERYEPLEEPAPAEKPRRRYRQKLKKYGKVGPHARPCPRARGAAGPTPGFRTDRPEGGRRVPTARPRSASLSCPCVPSPAVVNRHGRGFCPLGGEGKLDRK